MRLTLRLCLLMFVIGGLMFASGCGQSKAIRSLHTDLARYQTKTDQRMAALERRVAQLETSASPAKESEPILKPTEAPTTALPIREQCPRSTKLVQKALGGSGKLQVNEADASAMRTEWGKPPAKTTASDGDIFMWDLYKDDDGNFSQAAPGDESWYFAILTIPDNPEAPLLLTIGKRDTPAVIK